MASVTKLIFYIFLLVITTTEAEKKKSKEKIVIHVPYKIHKHHHTHTKFKVITIPTPKKENTIIYLKEEPLVKPVKIHDVTETHSKTSEPFIPPHQQSAIALLESLSGHKGEHIVQDQEQHSSTLTNDQKPLDTQLNEKKHFEEQIHINTQEFVPSIAYKPIILPSHVIPNFSFKPIILTPQHVLTPKLLINPGVHQSYEAFIPKLTYQPMLHLSQGHYNQKAMFKPIPPPKKVLQDNVAHSSSPVQKIVAPPQQKTKSYKVKEANPEDNMQLMKHQQITSNSVSVPSLKSNRKGKTYMHPGHQFKNIQNMIPPNPDYEYEHIGYLIIDGNSKKVVGKNFKDEIHLSR